MGLATFFTSLLTLSALAGKHVELGAPEIKGNGCNENTVSVTIAPDASALTLLFDSFIAENRDDQKRDRKNCQIVVPLDLEPDETVSILQMDYRGYTAVPKKGEADLVVDYWFGSKQGPPTKQRFKGEVDQEFLVTDTIKPSHKAWATCGRPIRLHIQAGIEIRTHEKGEQGIIGIDSVDMANGIVYRLERKKCQQVKDDRWDHPHKKKEADKKEREEERKRNENFEKRSFKEASRSSHK